MNHSQRQSELNAVGGNTMAWMSDRTRADDGDEPAGYCEFCDCEFPVSQMHSDTMCNRCKADGEEVELG